MRYESAALLTRDDFRTVRNPCGPPVPALPAAIRTIPAMIHRFSTQHNSIALTRHTAE